jgi:hypothetical protein
MRQTVIGFSFILLWLVACATNEAAVETGTVSPTNATLAFTVTPLPPTPAGDLAAATATAVTPMATQAVTATATAGPQLYTAEAFDFQFTIPAGYLLVEREHPDALLVVSLHETAVADDEQIHKPEIFVTVHDNPERLNLRAWFAAHTAETISDTYPIYVRPRLIQTRPVAGRPALSFEDNTFAPATVTLVEGDGYILALGFVPVDYPGLAEAFAELLASLTFGSAPPLTAVLPTPTSPPSFLCPGAEWPDAAWECRENPATGIRQCTAVDQEEAPVCFEDRDHPFALLLPPDWSTHLVLRQEGYNPFHATVIVKKQTFLHYDYGFSDVAIFMAGGQSLERWLASAQRRSGPSLFPQTELNATVAGRPAAIWVDDCPSQYFSSVGLVFSDGRHIYWWWHFAYDDETGMLPLRQMLDSLRFGEETAVPAEIPDDIWQEALQGCR